MSRIPAFVRLQYLLPKHALSRLAGWAAEARGGWLTTAFIRWFAKRYQVNMAEAAEPDLARYPTFNAFFTRALKDGVRPMVDDEQALVVPVDGAVSECGIIENGTLLQAKGHNYSLTALLGGDESLAARFAGGTFATIYLSPRDYHRIHMPVAGTLTNMIYVPGELFSVNQVTVQHVPDLFARNERVVTLFDTPVGPMAHILVGATIVGSMETVWAGTITPPRGAAPFTWHYNRPGQTPIQLARGEELGRFKLGSTVILLFGANAVTLTDAMKAGAPVQLGQHFADPQD